jgi:sugar lactone lactonase YvrE
LGSSACAKVAARGRRRIIAGMSLWQVEHVLAARARLGECPGWDPERGLLAWVDVYNHRVHQFEPATGRDRFFETGEAVAALALTRDERLLLALRDRLALLDPRTGALDEVCRLALGHPDTRLNDGKCDAQGRFWVGSISVDRGDASLYRYDPDGSVHVMETGLTISNGLGWSPDGKTFYLTDSPERVIYAYDFDVATGALGDRRVHVDLTGETVEPDGLSVDSAGQLWSALWDGWSLVCFDRNGAELERWELPVQRPTSLTFGGAELTDLYVTSASVGLSQAEVQRGICAGDLFRIATGVRGLPTHRFAAA